MNTVVITSRATGCTYILYSSACSSGPPGPTERSPTLINPGWEEGTRQFRLLGHYIYNKANEEEVHGLRKEITCSYHLHVTANSIHLSVTAHQCVCHARQMYIQRLLTFMYLLLCMRNNI